MLTLLVYACLIGSDDCQFAPVAGGFVHEKQCQSLSRLLAQGWLSDHPGMEIRRAVCTAQPQFLLHRFKA